MCSFNRGNTGGTDTPKNLYLMFVYVCFVLCLSRDYFVDWRERKFIIYTRRVLKWAFIFACDRVWLSRGNPGQLTGVTIRLRTNYTALHVLSGVNILGCWIAAEIVQGSSSAQSAARFQLRRQHDLHVGELHSSRPGHSAALLFLNVFCRQEVVCVSCWCWGDT